MFGYSMDLWDRLHNHTSSKNATCSICMMNLFDVRIMCDAAGRCCSLLPMFYPRSKVGSCALTVVLRGFSMFFVGKTINQLGGCLGYFGLILLSW